VLCTLAAIWLGLRTGRLIQHCWPVFAYFIWLFAGAAFARNPQVAVQSAAIDLIFLAVFCLAYIASRNDDCEILSKLMTITIIPICISAWWFFDRGAPRLGVRAFEVAPFIIPFAVYRLYRGSVFAYASVVATLGFLILTQSRAPFVGGLCAALLSAVWMAPNLKVLVRFAAILFGAVMICIPLWLSSHLATYYTAHALSRLSGMDIESGGVVFRAATDPVRGQIAETILGLLRDFHPLGIGYENFQFFFEDKFGSLVTLHSMYAVWLIELGIPGAAIVAFISWKAIRHIRSGLRKDHYWRVPATGLIMSGGIGLFHQAHQSPGLWFILGIIFGMRADMHQRPLRVCAFDQNEAQHESLGERARREIAKIDRRST
jgi:hypothetical protein